MIMRSLRIGMKAWIIASAIVGAFVLTLWGASVVFGPSASHFAFFSEKVHVGAGTGKLILCRWVARIDATGNIFPSVTDCKTYRGEPDIVHCFNGTTMGFEWNFCKYSKFTEWSVIVPIRPFLAILFVSAIGARLMHRRWTPLRPPAQPTASDAQ
jgi:hypothetical protein